MSSLSKSIGGGVYLAAGVVVLMVALAMLLAQADRIIALSGQPPIFAMCWLYVIYVIGNMLNTFFHELGHLIAGWMVGLTLHEFQVGRFRIEISSPSRTLQFRIAPAGAAGHVRADVPQGRCLVLRWSVFLLGGALGSFVLAACLLVIASEWNRLSEVPSETLRSPGVGELMKFRTDSFLLAPRSVVVAALNFVAAIALFSGAFNLIPISDRPWSDANNLRAVLRFKNPEHNFRVTNAMRRCRDLRPREWPIVAIDQITKLSRERGDDATCDHLLYYYHLDAGRIADARRHLDSALSRIDDPADYPVILLEGGYFYARYLGDVNAAKEFRHRSGSLVTREPQTRIRCDAAIMFAEGGFAAARDKAWEAIEAMKGCWDNGGAIGEREWLATLALEAEHRRAAESAGPALVEQSQS